MVRVVETIPYVAPYMRIKGCRSRNAGEVGAMQD
jgi:hypothetical protein